MKKTIFKNLTKIIKASALMAIIILLTCGKLPAVTTSADTANVANCLGNELKAGQILQFNQYLKSDGGDYTASLQQNGSLVVYNKDNSVKFSIQTGTNLNSNSYKLLIETNGNLEISNDSNVPIWQTQIQQNTDNQSIFKLDNDGNIQIINNNVVIWQNNQAVPQSVGSQLNMGQSINPNQYLTSDNGNYTARIQQDGNLVVYDKNKKAIWATNTFSNGNSNSNSLNIQKDGNLVVYDQNKKPLWASGTDQFQQSSFLLKLGNDGYLNILSNGNLIWNNKVGKIGSIGNTLQVGQTMFTQQYLASSNGQYTAHVEQNGNLVIYNKDGQSIWDTSKYSNEQSSDNRLRLQSDGNLVVYDKSYKAVWASGTYSANGAILLELDDFGDLRLLSNNTMLWSSGSGKAGSIGSTLGVGQIMWTSQYLTSDNGKYTFHIEKSGNLAIYDKNNVVMWSSDSNDSSNFSDNRLKLQSDGNLVAYGDGWNVLWAAGTEQPKDLQSNLSLKLDDNGCLNILSNGKAVWDSVGGKFGTIGNTLNMGQTLWSNQYILSSNGKYSARIQKDGSFVLYDFNNNPIWNSGKLGDPSFQANRLKLQLDGNVVAYGRGKNAIWSTETCENVGANFLLRLDDDGVLRLMSNDTMIWDNARGKVGSIGSMLQMGQHMYTSQYLSSDNGKYNLHVQQDGNLVIYDENHNVIWATNKYGDNNFTDNTLILGTDGNLLVNGENSQTIWQSETVQNSGDTFYIKLDNNGDLRLFSNSKMIWNSYGGGIHSIGNTLRMGETMWTTESLTSTNGEYRLSVQDDGNLVIYNKNNKPIWASSGFGSSSFTDNRLKLQGDGNLVMYGENYNVIWASNTESSNSAASLMLRLDDDGDLRLYADDNMLWDSNRGKVGSIGSAIDMGKVMWTSQFLTSDNGQYTLHIQKDGNLVIYDKNNRPVWASYSFNNSGFNDNRLSVQQDGNLVIYGENSRPLWAAGTDQGGNHKYSIKLENNGYLNVVKDGYWIWSSDALTNRRIKLDVYATKYLGCPYVWGATGQPLSQADINKYRGTDHDLTGMEKYIGMPSFDCSGFVQYVYKQFGYSIGRTTYDQIYDGVPVDKNDLQPGDIIFFGDYSAPHHEAIYLGNGFFIEAPESRAFVQISSLNGRTDFCRARRIIL